MIYSNFFRSKIENFQRKSFDIFLLLLQNMLQNIDCGYSLEPPRRGGSNVYPQSMFWSKKEKNRYTPAYPQFYYIKVGFKGIFIARTCFPDVSYSKLSKITCRAIHTSRQYGCMNNYRCHFIPL